MLAVRSFSVELELQLGAGVDVPKVVVLLSFPPVLDVVKNGRWRVGRMGIRVREREVGCE